MSDDPDPNVRLDLGGWISGPMIDLEPTVDDVRRAFPGWTVYRGTDQLWHARRKDAAPPARIVTGEDLQDLADMIRREVSKEA
jgi:hypothetical protein